VLAYLINARGAHEHTVEEIVKRILDQFPLAQGTKDQFVLSA